jgi:hypothetical protein
MQVRGLIGIQNQVLLHKAEGVFDGEAPEVHPAQVGGRDGGGASPEQPQGALVARRAVVSQELQSQDTPHQGYQRVEWSGFVWLWTT